MTQTPSKSRQRAEAAFGEAQSQFLARERPAEGPNSDVQAQAEKTRRLREARLAREEADAAAPASKRGR